MIRPIRPIEPPPVAKVASARPRTRRFRKADVLRAMDAARAGGFLVAAIEIRADGTIRLSAANAEALNAQADDFAKWEKLL